MSDFSSEWKWPSPDMDSVSDDFADAFRAAYMARFGKKTRGFNCGSGTEKTEAQRKAAAEVEIGIGFQHAKQLNAIPKPRRFVGPALPGDKPNTPRFDYSRFRQVPKQHLKTFIRRAYNA